MQQHRVRQTKLPRLRKQRRKVNNQTENGGEIGRETKLKRAEETGPKIMETEPSYDYFLPYFIMPAKALSVRYAMIADWC